MYAIVGPNDHPKKAEKIATTIKFIGYESAKNITQKRNRKLPQIVINNSVVVSYALFKRAVIDVINNIPPRIKNVLDISKLDSISCILQNIYFKK